VYVLIENTLTLKESFCCLPLQAQSSGPVLKERLEIRYTSTPCIHHVDPHQPHHHVQAA
jgi:hypothetical protein